MWNLARSDMSSHSKNRTKKSLVGQDFTQGHSVGVERVSPSNSHHIVSFGGGKISHKKVQDFTQKNFCPMNQMFFSIISCTNFFCENSSNNECNNYILYCSTIFLHSASWVFHHWLPCLLCIFGCMFFALFSTTSNIICFAS